MIHNHLRSQITSCAMSEINLCSLDNLFKMKLKQKQNERFLSRSILPRKSNMFPVCFCIGQLDKKAIEIFEFDAATLIFHGRSCSFRAPIKSVRGALPHFWCDGRHGQLRIGIAVLTNETLGVLLWFCQSHQTH